MNRRTFLANSALSFLTPGLMMSGQRTAGPRYRACVIGNTSGGVPLRLPLKAARPFPQMSVRRPNLLARLSATESRQHSVFATESMDTSPRKKIDMEMVVAGERTFSVPRAL
jgi:hypothetical protein